MPTLAGNKQHFHPTHPSQDALFPHSTKMDGPSLSEIDSKVFICEQKFCLQAK